MALERQPQSQPSQIIDGERLQAIKNIQRNLNPFREDCEDSKLRDNALNNFYLEMTDPSLEFLVGVSGSLISLTSDDLYDLRSDVYDASGKSGQPLEVGIYNSRELLNSIVMKHNFGSWVEQLDPKAFAEETHEKIQLDKGERQLRTAVEMIQNEPNLRKRYQMGKNLKKQILDHIHSFPFVIYSQSNRDETFEPTWDNLTSLYGYSVRLDTKDGGSVVGYFAFEDAIDATQGALTRYPFEKKLEKLPARDKERFDQLRLQYGAKAANLTILSEYVGDINKLRGRSRFFTVQLAVPDFKAVPVDLYRLWKEGKPLDDALIPYFKWASELKVEDDHDSDDSIGSGYMVRSSAVFSEDGENVTGAGVYKSIRVYKGATYEEFIDAVTKVYESTNSPQAQAYRTQHGIDKEEMGLVVQKYVSPRASSMHEQSQQGYANSKLSGVPGLMEVVTKTSRNFVKRKELDFFLALDADMNEGAFRAAHHFPPDQFKVNADLPIRIAQLTSVVERIWGKDIQVEFVANFHKVNFVQVRELPPSVSQLPEVQFPDEQPIHTGASIGIGDMDLPVLEDYKNNNENIGVVVIQGNHMWTMGNNSYCLPKEGAVIIATNNGDFGHIQTLCAELGLVCVFPDVNEKDKPTLQYRELLRFGRIRIVSNGIEARLYPVGDESPFAERENEWE